MRKSISQILIPGKSYRSHLAQGRMNLRQQEVARSVLFTPGLLKYITEFQDGKKFSDWGNNDTELAILKGYEFILRKKNLVTTNPNHRYVSFNYIIHEMIKSKRLDTRTKIRVMEYFYDTNQMPTENVKKNHRKDPHTTRTTCAASTGQLSLLKWLVHQKGEKISGTWPVTWAAMNGHLQMVRYLCINLKAKFSKCAMNFASQHGHLNIVKFLHGINAPCNAAALNWAIGGGHMEVVKFLVNNRREGYTHTSLKWAAKNGHQDIIDYVLSRRQPRYSKVANEDIRIFDDFDLYHFEDWY